MKYLLLIALGTMLASCTSAQKKSECKVTCLEKNAIYESVERHGCMCVEKEDPSQKIYNDVDLD